MIAVGAAAARGSAGVGAARGTERALPADAAADLVGVNTHLYYPGVYTDSWERAVLPRLVELGVRHIRDGAATGNALYASRLRQLAQVGIRATLILDTRWGLATRLEQSREMVSALNGGARPVVEAIEPPNEFDSGEAWEGRLAAILRELRSLCKADPRTARLPMLGPSFANTRDSAVRLAGAFPGIASEFDTANLHCYSGGNPTEGPLGGGWGISLDDAISRYRRLSAGRPLIATETGFHNATGAAVPGFPGVSERAAAALTLRLLLVYLQKGFTRAFLYELIDEGGSPTNHEHHFGLLRRDGAPKAQFTAVRNLVRLLRDPGPPFKTGALAYGLQGNGQGLCRALLQKRDGRFYLALWQPAVSVDPGDRTDTIPPAREVTVTLRSAARVRVFDPLTSEGPVADAGRVRSVVARVGDSPAVVEIAPPAGGRR